MMNTTFGDIIWKFIFAISIKLFRRWYSKKLNGGRKLQSSSKNFTFMSKKCSFKLIEDSYHNFLKSFFCFCFVFKQISEKIYFQDLGTTYISASLYEMLWDKKLNSKFWFRYKPVIVFEGVAYIVTWCLLLWGKAGPPSVTSTVQSPNLSTTEYVPI